MPLMIPRYTILSQEDIQRIHQCSVQVLQRVGVQVAHSEVLERLAAAGAAVEALSDRKAAPEEVVIQPADEAVPDWITQLGQTGTLEPGEDLPQEEEEPDW